MKDSRLASILGEWRSRLDHGEHVDPEDVIRANPDLADQLRAQFRALSKMRHAQATKRAPTTLRTLPIDRYGEFKPAGEGGMGIVYWAIDTDLNREVAFKIIRPGGKQGETPLRPTDLATPAKDTPASQAFETLKQRFLQEAWITSGMAHPGIVPVYELGQTPEGVPYYTMRFIKGDATLATAIEDAKTKGIEERLALLEPFLKVCDALRYAHSRRVIHRDLKPENVALGEFGEAVILDWGLARVQGTDEPGGDRLAAHIQEYRDATDLRTIAGAMGTPGYMPPEAALGQSELMDERSDVFSLGAILFEILTGRIPHEFTTFPELAMKLLRDAPPRAQDVDATVPGALSDLCAWCLARDRAARPASVDALATAIRDWQLQRKRDSEVERLIAQAQTALAAAEGLEGAALVGPLDQAGAACAQALERRPAEPRVLALAARVQALRDRGAREQVREARRRLLVRGGTTVLAVAVLAGVWFANTLDLKRVEAEQSRAQAEVARATAQRRLATMYAQRGREEFASGHAGRALAYLSEAYTQGGRSPALRLLLAQASRQLAAPVRVIRPGGLFAFAPDGARLAISSEAGLVVVDAATGRVLVTARDAPHESLQPVFAPTGEQIAAAQPDGAALLWSAQDGALLHRLVDPQMAPTPAARSALPPFAAAAAFSPDGTLLATAGRDRKARIWDVPSGRLVRVIAPHRYPVSSVAFDAGGSRLLTVELDDHTVDAYDGAAYLWDVATGERLAGFVPPQDAALEEDLFCVGSAALSPDGRLVATGPRSLDPTARIWNADTGSLVQRLHVPDAMILSVAFDPQGRRVATACVEMSAGATGVVRVWNARETRPPLVIRAHPGMVTVATFSPDGRHLLTAGLDKAIRIWDAESGKALASLESGAENVLGASFDPGGTRVAALGSDGALRVWTLDDASGGLRHEGRLCDEARCFTPDGRVVIAASSAGVALYELETGTRVGWLEGPAYEAELGPDGTRVLTRHPDGTVTVRDVATGASLATIAPGWPPVATACFSPDGRLVMTTPSDPGRAATLWDAATGQRLREVGASDGPILSAQFSPGGERILTASGGPSARTLHLVDVATGRSIAQLDGLPTVAFGPDGRLMAYACVEGIRVARVADGEAVVTFPAAWTGEVQVALDHDSRRLVAWTGGSSASVWDLSTRERCASLEGIPGMLAGMTFSPDGAFLVTVAAGVSLWDAETGERLVDLEYPQAEFARFSPDGRRLLIQGAPPGISSWDLMLEARPAAAVAAFVEARVPWRLQDERLVPALSGPDD